MRMLKNNSPPYTAVTYRMYGTTTKMKNCNFVFHAFAIRRELLESKIYLIDLYFFMNITEGFTIMNIIKTKWWNSDEGVPIFMIRFKWRKRKHTGSRLKLIHTYKRGGGEYICCICQSRDEITFCFRRLEWILANRLSASPALLNVVAFSSGEHIDGMFVQVCWYWERQHQKSMNVIRNGIEWNNNKMKFQ